MARTVPLPEPLAHNASDIAIRLQCSKPFVYKLIADGRLPHVRIGRSVRVMHDDLLAFLESHRSSHDAA